MGMIMGGIIPMPRLSEWPAQASEPVCTKTSPPLLSLQGVVVRRNGRVVLQALDLSVPAGGITAVVGPSGAGKSTLMATLNGLHPLWAGQIQVAGVGCLDHPTRWRRHRQQTATVFQEHALIARLSALENVLLGRADQRHPLSLLPWPRALQQQALEALEQVNLLDKALQPVAQLSGGERQRVGIARALVRQPRLLLADEPFASVDPALRQYMVEMFKDWVNKQGLTLIIVLHQLELARQLADRILGLHEGQLAFDGPTNHFDAEAQARLFPNLGTTGAH